MICIYCCHRVCYPDRIIMSAIQHIYTPQTYMGPLKGSTCLPLRVADAHERPRTYMYVDSKKKVYFWTISTNIHAYINAQVTDFYFHKKKPHTAI